MVNSFNYNIVSSRVSGSDSAPANLPTLRIEYEAVWAPYPVRTLWGREKFLVSAGNRTTNPRTSILSNELWQICFAVSGSMPFPILELVCRCSGSNSSSQSVILELA